MTTKDALAVGRAARARIAANLPEILSTLGNVTSRYPFASESDQARFVARLGTKEGAQLETHDAHRTTDRFPSLDAVQVPFLQ